MSKVRSYFESCMLNLNAGSWMLNLNLKDKKVNVGSWMFECWDVGKVKV